VDSEFDDHDMSDFERHLRVDELFNTLPSSRQKRWELLKTFFARWYEPLTPKNDVVVETDADTWIWVSAKSNDTFRAVIDALSNQGVGWEQVTED